MITQSDFPKLTDYVDDIFNEVAKTSVADMKGNKIFRVRDTSLRSFEHLILHGMSGIQEVTPGQDFPNVTSEEGDSITWTQRQYGAKVSVTEEMRMFDRYSQLESIVRSISTDAFDKIDQSLADVLLYGTATTYTDVYGKSVAAVGPDGLALFSASHSNNLNTDVFSNIITSNPALSRAAIVTARKLGLTHKDPNGMIRPVHLDSIIVSPENEDLIERILYSEKMSGTGNNDLNPMKGKIKNVYVWERMQTRSDGTDTSAYWFMFDSSKIGETLNCLFAKRPVLQAPEKVYKNGNWDYALNYYNTIGIGYAPYIFGSTGAGA